VDVFHLVPGGGIRRLTVEVRRDPLDHRARLVTLRPSSQDRSVSAPVPSLPSKKQRLLDALRETGGNRAAAARRLGIGRTTLYAQLRRFGIALPGDQD
jgi:transcriptional regulator of acetoin/glycerol metabolism